MSTRCVTLAVLRCSAQRLSRTFTAMLSNVQGMFLNQLSTKRSLGTYQSLQEDSTISTPPFHNPCVAGLTSTLLLLLLHGDRATFDNALASALKVSCLWWA